MNILGYHGTLSNYAKSILQDGYKFNQKINPEHDHWLGHGIYFYVHYELALWWGRTKSNAFKRKRGIGEGYSVIKSSIQCDKEKILDLDNPIHLDGFFSYYKNKELELKKAGYIIDFTKGLDCQKYSEDNYHRIIRERIRCTYLDFMKHERNYEVVMYTFSKDDPSYANSIHKYYGMANTCLSYKEKQICVTTNDIIIKSEICFSHEEEII